MDQFMQHQKAIAKWEQQMTDVSHQRDEYKNELGALKNKLDKATTENERLRQENKTLRRNRGGEGGGLQFKPFMPTRFTAANVAQQALARHGGAHLLGQSDQADGEVATDRPGIASSMDFGSKLGKGLLNKFKLGDQPVAASMQLGT